MHNLASVGVNILLRKPQQGSATLSVLPWDEISRLTEKVVFLVELGTTTGTCFAVSISPAKNKKNKIYTFATAWHVIEKLTHSNKPIKLTTADKSKAYEIMHDRYEIFREGPKELDTGIIEVETEMPLVSKKNLLPMLDFDELLPRGSEIAAVGFPGLANEEFCFFRGVVSGYGKRPPSYLVDGVVLNGVSGGPAVDQRARIIGLVSSYLPNRIDRNTTLPGLTTLIPISSIRSLMGHRGSD